MLKWSTKNWKNSCSMAEMANFLAFSASLFWVLYWYYWELKAETEYHKLKVSWGLHMGGALEVWPYCIKKKFKKTICCIKIYGGKCTSIYVPFWRVMCLIITLYKLNILEKRSRDVCEYIHGKIRQYLQKRGIQHLTYEQAYNNFQELSQRLKKCHLRSSKKPNVC